jgi:hypothetical protein
MLGWKAVFSLGGPLIERSAKIESEVDCLLLVSGAGGGENQQRYPLKICLRLCDRHLPFVSSSSAGVGCAFGSPSPGCTGGICLLDTIDDGDPESKYHHRTSRRIAFETLIRAFLSCPLLCRSALPS